MQLDEQTVAVVTGAGNGLGQAIAYELAKRNCRLALIDIDHEGLGRTSKLLPDCRASYHVLNVADRRALACVAEQIKREHACVHLLVNNAGVSLSGQFEEFDVEDFEWLMGVNFWGVIYACKCFLPLLTKASEARICNILSGFALVGFPSKSAYAASKFAVRGFSESLQMELYSASINVTCVYLGTVNTRLVERGRACDPAKHRLEAQFLAGHGMPAARAARRICRAVETNRARVRIGRETFIFDGLARFFPNVTRRLISNLKSKIAFA